MTNIVNIYYYICDHTFPSIHLIYLKKKKNYVILNVYIYLKNCAHYYINMFVYYLILNP